MSKQDKITWEMIYNDFRERHPLTGRKVKDYRPYDQLTIVMWISDGSKITYNYLDKKVRILDEGWGE